jgi:hypothetical protein
MRIDLLYYIFVDVRREVLAVSHNIYKFIIKVVSIPFNIKYL